MPWKMQRGILDHVRHLILILASKLEFCSSCIIRGDESSYFEKPFDANYEKPKNEQPNIIRAC